MPETLYLWFAGVLREGRRGTGGIPCCANSAEDEDVCNNEGEWDP